MTLLVYLISLLQFLTGADDVSLVFAGDAMQHERQIKAAAVSGGGHDYKACFRHVADYVGSADYAVVNLECPLGGKPYAGYPCFSAPDEFAEALRVVRVSTCFFKPTTIALTAGTKGCGARSTVLMKWEYRIRELFAMQTTGNSVKCS